jgi:transposase InsO family protein
MYLFAIVDLFSRFIVGWSLSNTMTDDWVVNTINETVKSHGIPKIINSDQGSQFASNDYINYLKKPNIQISVDGKGRATDNTFIERFFRRLSIIKYTWNFLKMEQNYINTAVNLVIFITITWSIQVLTTKHRQNNSITLLKTYN